ncbi:MAG: type II CAAX endopeptidase family protein [Cyanobacteriota bacterium]|nr:type II CAAX endopeptidase family protein [Cyanobacteriota bacterium]
MLKFNFGFIAHYPAPVRLGIFVLTLIFIWLPFAVPIYWLETDANKINILTLSILYIEFILLLRFWGKHIYKQPQLLRSYGLVKSRENGLLLLQGLAVGLFSLFGLFILQGLLGWAIWQPPQISLLRYILEGLLVSLGLGFAEELTFRGWLLDELERDYDRKVALWVSSLIFALLHFIKPVAEIIRTLPEFPALFLLGLICVWAKRSTVSNLSIASFNNQKRLVRRKQELLGLPMGFHAGLVWGFYIINVGELVEYSGKVPRAIVSVDRPLAGVMGLLFLSAIAFWMRKAANK